MSEPEHLNIIREDDGLWANYRNGVKTYFLELEDEYMSLEDEEGEEDPC